MKKLLKKLLRENLLKEERFYSSNLSRETILTSYANSLTLYDTNFWESETPEDGVIGHIVIGREGKELFVETSYAKKGYGPLMYELAMQSVYDNPLTPSFDGNVNSKALRIWEYFYAGNNPDVTVVELKEGDDGYRDFIGYHGVDDSVIHLFNSRFYMEADEYYMLDTNAEDFF